VTLAPRPLVSVVIPARDAEAYIADAIVSVLRQTYEPVECIVVDDGSTDDTSTIVQQHYGVLYLRQENRGVVAARHAGVRVSRGPFIAFLDADDVWVEHKLVVQMALFLTNPGLGMVYSGVETVDPSLRRIREYECASPADAVANALLLRQPYLFATTMVVSRAAFDEVGGFDARLTTSADTDLACRIAAHFPIDCVFEPLVRYRQHEGQMHRNLAAFERDMRVIHEKFFGGVRKRCGVSRRQAAASLHVALALANLSHGARSAALGQLFAALRQSPARAGRMLLESAARRVSPVPTR